jgi:hypothetical protein
VASAAVALDRREPSRRHALTSQVLSYLREAAQQQALTADLVAEVRDFPDSSALLERVDPDDPLRMSFRYPDGDSAQCRNIHIGAYLRRLWICPILLRVQLSKIFAWGLWARVCGVLFVVRVVRHVLNVRFGSHLTAATAAAQQKVADLAADRLMVPPDASPLGSEPRSFARAVRFV